MLYTTVTAEKFEAWVELLEETLPSVTVVKIHSRREVRATLENGCKVTFKATALISMQGEYYYAEENSGNAVTHYRFADDWFDMTSITGKGSRSADTRQTVRELFNLLSL